MQQLLYSCGRPHVAVSSRSWLYRRLQRSPSPRRKYSKFPPEQLRPTISHRRRRKAILSRFRHSWSSSYISSLAESKSKSTNQHHQWPYTSPIWRKPPHLCLPNEHQNFQVEATPTFVSQTPKRYRFHFMSHPQQIYPPMDRIECTSFQSSNAYHSCPLGSGRSIFDLRRRSLEYPKIWSGFLCSIWKLKLWLQFNTAG